MRLLFLFFLTTIPGLARRGNGQRARGGATGDRPAIAPPRRGLFWTARARVPFTSRGCPRSFFVRCRSLSSDDSDPAIPFHLCFFSVFFFLLQISFDQICDAKYIRTTYRRQGYCCNLFGDLCVSKCVSLTDQQDHQGSDGDGYVGNLRYDLNESSAVTLHPRNRECILVVLLSSKSLLSEMSMEKKCV